MSKERPAYKDNPNPRYANYEHPPLDKFWTSLGGSVILAERANFTYCEACVFGSGWHAYWCPETIECHGCKRKVAVNDTIPCTHATTKEKGHVCFSCFRILGETTSIQLQTTT